MNNFLKVTSGVVILAVGMIVSAAVLSKFFVRIRHEQAITVKGYAEKDVVSDIGQFSCTCQSRGTSLAEAFGKLQDGKRRVTDYLRDNGFSESEVETGTIGTVKVSKRDVQGKETNETEYYDVAQTLTVTSTNVLHVRQVATAITDLIKEGLDLSASPPEFYVSDLKDTKLELLAEATADAYKRAVTLAESSHGKVGALMSAQQGVFQITARHSTDTSGYGMYDTATIEKTAKAVVTLDYAIETDK
jgi:hypothetical protein